MQFPQWVLPTLAAVAILLVGGLVFTSYLLTERAALLEEAQSELASSTAAHAVTAERLRNELGEATAQRQELSNALGLARAQKDDLERKVGTLATEVDTLAKIVETDPPASREIFKSVFP